MPADIRLDKQAQGGTLRYELALADWAFGEWDQFAVFVPEEGEPSMQLLGGFSDTSGQKILDEEIYETIIAEAVQTVREIEESVPQMRRYISEIAEAFGYGDFVEGLVPQQEEAPEDPQSLEAMRRAGYILEDGAHSLEDAKKRDRHPKNRTKVFGAEDGRLWSWDRMHGDHYDVLMKSNKYIKRAPDGRQIGEPKDATVHYKVLVG